MPYLINMILYKMVLCPCYRQLPQNSDHPQRHGGRDAARWRFRHVCLPARLILIAALAFGGPRLHDNGRFVLGALASLAFLFVARKYILNNHNVWWSRKYLLAETACAAAVFFTLQLPLACYVVSGLLALHWLCSAYIAAVWPPSAAATAAKLARFNRGELFPRGEMDLMF